MQEGEDFIKALRFENLELRTNPEHCTTEGPATIDVTARKRNILHLEQIVKYFLNPFIRKKISKFFE